MTDYEDIIKIKLAEILAKHNLKIVDCNMYEKRGRKVPDSFYVPANIVVSPYWLARVLFKELERNKLEEEE